MSTLDLFFVHVGFIIGAFLLSLVVGTLVFYFRKEETSFVGCGTRFIEHASDRKYNTCSGYSEKADCEEDYAIKNVGIANKDFEDIEIVFPLRQTDWASRHVLSNSPSS